MILLFFQAIPCTDVLPCHQAAKHVWAGACKCKEFVDARLRYMFSILSSFSPCLMSTSPPAQIAWSSDRVFGLESFAKWKQGWRASNRTDPSWHVLSVLFVLWCIVYIYVYLYIYIYIFIFIYIYIYLYIYKLALWFVIAEHLYLFQFLAFFLCVSFQSEREREREREKENGLSPTRNCNELRETVPWSSTVNVSASQKTHTLHHKYVGTVYNSGCLQPGLQTLTRKRASH